MLYWHVTDDGKFIIFHFVVEEWNIFSTPPKKSEWMRGRGSRWDRKIKKMKCYENIIMHNIQLIIGVHQASNSCFIENTRHLFLSLSLSLSSQWTKKSCLNEHANNIFILYDEQRSKKNYIKKNKIKMSNEYFKSSVESNSMAGKLNYTMTQHKTKYLLHSHHST
jgi:hypothetical protein